MNNKTQLQALLHGVIENLPDKTAIYFGPRAYSYRDLDRFSRKLASAMQGKGIESGDRVALFLPNCPEAILIFLACYRIGAIAVPLNYRYVSGEARYVLEQTRPELIVFHSEKLETVSSFDDLFPSESMFVVNDTDSYSRYQSFDELFDFPELVCDCELPDSHPAFILYTSGSTGDPKGVVHSHAGAYHAIEISCKALDFEEQDIVLLGKSISHAGGLQTQLMPALSVGATVVLAMAPSPHEAVSLIDRHQVTEYGMLASDLLDFIEYLEEHPHKLSSLRNAIGSGDAVPVELHRRFRALFGWEILEGCGMTEVGCYYSMNPRHGTRKWGSMGKPCPDMQIRIVDDQGIELPCGETGEIEVRTPSATIGYWNDAESSRLLFKNDWLLTGDSAYCDEQGYLWFVGRKKMMIVRRGSNISPIEVENVIDRHPVVHASVVVGIPDSRDGQLPVAFIAPLHDTRSPEPEELKKYLKARIAEYKVPEHFYFLAELPRNPTGKFDRHQLELMAKSIALKADSTRSR